MHNTQECQLRLAATLLGTDSAATTEKGAVSQPLFPDRTSVTR
jgi:hypothetical protein